MTARVVDVEDSSFVIDVVYKYSSERQTRFTQYTYTFRLSVGSENFENHCYCFGAYAEQATASFDLGDEVTVFDAPAIPANAVVCRGIMPSQWVTPGMMIFGMVMTCYGLWLQKART